MSRYLSNAFSMNMLSMENFCLIRARKVNSLDVPKSVISAIGHADTARVVSKILGFHVPENRINVSLKAEDVLYVAQYKGPRLPEGATELPEGATIEFMELTVKPEGCRGCREGNCNSCDMIGWTNGYPGY